MEENGKMSKPKAVMSFFDCVVMAINSLLQEGPKAVADDDRWCIRLQQQSVFDRVKNLIGAGSVTCAAFDGESYRQIIPRLKKTYEEAGWAEVSVYDEADACFSASYGYTLTFFASAAPNKVIPVAPEEIVG